MIRYIITMTPSKQIGIEKRAPGKKMSYIAKSTSPITIENAMQAEARKMAALGTKFQIENRTNVFLEV